ncbi:MAG TPA: alpha/beta hydrolase [Actinocrinis sp.]
MPQRSPSKHSVRAYIGRAGSAGRTGGLRRAGRALPIAAAMVLAAACTGSASGQPVAASSPAQAGQLGAPPGLESYYTQKIGWNSCDNGWQCGTLKVPLNYADPGGQSIEIAVTRKQASNRSERIGSLLVNPGGPGGSGIQYAQSSGIVSSNVEAHFDLVGFDPRGVGQSTPAVHCVTDSQMDTFLNTPPDPTGQSEINQIVNQSKFFANQCEADSASLLPYVGTVNAARDMDVLRAALGDSKLYYLGKSYGTYLGAVYAQEFPTRVGRVVLDGALDPSLTAEQMNLAQATAFDDELNQYAQSCVKQSGCPLGTDATTGLAKLKTWVDGLDQHPISGDATRKLTEAQAMTGIAFAMYSPSYWPDLTNAITNAYSGNGALMLSMADAYNDRVNGKYQGNETEANFAVNCVDHPDEAASLQQVEQELPTFEQAAPFFGQMIDWSSLPCAYWGAKPDTTPHKITAQGAAPILVVGTTQDPATPYAWAQSLASQLSSGHLLTMNGFGHTAYMLGTSCIDTAVDAYLINDTLPATGTVCQQGH